MILVTGGTGHIGNNLIKRLSEKFGKDNIRVFLRKPDVKYLEGYYCECVIGDLSQKEKVDEAVKDCEYVFHTAAVIDLSKKMTDNVYHSNVIGTKNIVDACLKYNVKKLVYTSSVEAICTPKDGEIIEQREEIDNIKCGGYAISKVMSLKEIDEGIKQGLNVSVVYPSAVIGVRDYRGSYSLYIIKLYASKFPLKFYFKGAYNFVDVRDVADAMINALNVEHSGDYILGGERLTIKQAAKTIAAASGVKALYIPIPLFLVKFFAFVWSGIKKLFKKTSPFNPYSISILSRNCNFNCKKAKEELLFLPRPVKTTFCDTINWLKEQKRLKKQLQKSKK